MLDVLTVTLNPALDLSTSAAHVVPTHKIRCESLQRYPGGGGVNVARVIHRLGGQCTALYPAGGANGAVFQQLLDEEGVPSLCIPIAGETRENFSVKDIAINDEFRFVLPGPALQTGATVANGFVTAGTFNNVKGVIRNTGTATADVPDLRASLSGPSGVALRWTIVPQIRRLPAGGKTEYSSTVTGFPPNARSVAITPAWSRLF